MARLGRSTRSEKGRAVQAHGLPPGSKGKSPWAAAFAFELPRRQVDHTSPASADAPASTGCWAGRGRGGGLSCLFDQLR